MFWFNTFLMSMLAGCFVTIIKGAQLEDWVYVMISFLSGVVITGLRMEWRCNHEND